MYLYYNAFIPSELILVSMIVMIVFTIYQYDFRWQKIYTAGAGPYGNLNIQIIYKPYQTKRINLRDFWGTDGKFCASDGRI